MKISLSCGQPENIPLFLIQNKTLSIQDEDQKFHFSFSKHLFYNIFYIRNLTACHFKLLLLLKVLITMVQLGQASLLSGTVVTLSFSTLSKTYFLPPHFCLALSPARKPPSQANLSPPPFFSFKVLNEAKQNLEKVYLKQIN